MPFINGLTERTLHMSNAKRDVTRISHNTKIVATLGPGSNNVQLLEDMIRVGGLNVVRFNFSHGTPEFHQENARIVREAAKRAGQEIAILADLQGPKIRVGKIAGGSIELNKGETLVLDAALEGEGTRDAVGLDYRDLPNDVVAGDVLWLDDGLLTLTVESVEGSKIVTKVENSHVLKSNKGINKRGGGLSAGALTEKDFRDLKTAIAIGCDYLAISFVKSAEDLHIARAKVEEEMKGSTAVRPGLVSKIERVEAIENLDEIILASDGIMVARGDLAVEVGHAAVPALQKRMIRRARELRRFSIAAAEKEQDSLNGVAEQVDYPEAVSTNLAIAGGAVSVARAVHAKAIVALTESGSTAFEVSRHNITLPIFALTPSISAQRRMAMYRGVRPLILATSTDHDTALNEVEAMLVEHKILSSGDQYIITSGSQMRESGSTNTLEVLRVK